MMDNTIQLRKEKNCVNSLNYLVKKSLMRTGFTIGFQEKMKTVVENAREEDDQQHRRQQRQKLRRQHVELQQLRLAELQHHVNVIMMANSILSLKVLNCVDTTRKLAKRDQITTGSTIGFQEKTTTAVENAKEEGDIILQVLLAKLLQLPDLPQRQQEKQQQAINASMKVNIMLLK